MGDTVTTSAKPATEALSGYTEPLPMVFSGLYPIDGSDYPILREALDKLHDKERTAWRDAGQREEQAELDEIATMRAARGLGAVA